MCLETNYMKSNLKEMEIHHLFSIRVFNINVNDLSMLVFFFNLSLCFLIKM